MRLRVTLARSGGRDDVDLSLDLGAQATVGELADALTNRDPSRAAAASGPVTLSLEDAHDAVPRRMRVADTVIRSGSRLRVVPVEQRAERAEADVVAELEVVGGPDAGQRVPLRWGANTVGRLEDNDVVLNDPLVSKHHARITVTDVVEVVDLGSANGVVIGGDLTPRGLLGADDTMLVGDSMLRVIHRLRSAVRRDGGAEAFTRPPVIRRDIPAVVVPAPAPPVLETRTPIPVLAMLMPLAIGAILYAVTRQVTSIIFIALSPLLLASNALEGSLFGRRRRRRQAAAYEAQLAEMVTSLATFLDEERRVHLTRAPSTAELIDACVRRGPLLWSRRPEQDSFLDIRLGLGSLPASTGVELPHTDNGVPALVARLHEVVAENATVQGVPVLGSVRSGLGVVGPREQCLQSARAVITQIAALHSPVDVTIAAVVASDKSHDWEWLKWLPHVTLDPRDPLAIPLASTPVGAIRQVAEYEELQEKAESNSGSATGPWTILIIDGEVPIERSRLVSLAADAQRHRVIPLWVARAAERLPAVCTTYVDVDAQGGARVVLVDQGLTIEVAREGLSEVDAEGFARSLSPVVDDAAEQDVSSELPATASLLRILGSDASVSGEDIVDRWRTSGSLPDTALGGNHQLHLRAVVGAAAGQNFALDLRSQGPHALVGGTTGSGKSEFLQSWITALALDHSPARINFLFIDYKGGAAFADCRHLPHAIGLVTDLSPHLVRRALASLRAEVRYREQVLRAKKAKDLLELERRGDPEAPPSLVIVVDEFAALVSEVPEFVDGVVDVAQRGRSLGLHLILATQRPAGVIKDNIRANTNMRIALRMADADDSTDVVGSPVAAGFDSALPGRGVAKLGPGRLTPFQAGYVGGWTTAASAAPAIEIAELGFGGGIVWEKPVDSAKATADGSGPNDLVKLVHALQEAHAAVGLPAPRRPWLPELAPVYDLAKMWQSRTDSNLVYGLRDQPDTQAQVPASFQPDQDGNLAVFGTGGSGKSVLLRTLAISAGLGLRGGPCLVHALDFGSGGLRMLEALPHVGSVIGGDDHERIVRLLRMLREIVDERSRRYAVANAGSITDYRRAANKPEEARYLLLLDGIGAFRQAYSTGDRLKWFDLLVGLAADGRQVGVHLAISAERPAALSAGLSALVQHRIVLRLSDDNDYSVLGVPVDALQGAPPGRGLVDDEEVQIAVLGGSNETSRQAKAINRLARELAAARPDVVSPPIGRLPERIYLSEMPVESGGLPTIGVSDEQLEPIAFQPGGCLVIAGPPLSGRTSALGTFAFAMHRWRPRRPIAYLGSGTSPLIAALPWSDAAGGPDDVAALAKELVGRLSSHDPGVELLTVVIEELPSFLNTAADLPVQELLRTAAGEGCSVIVNGETSAIIGSWPLLLAARADRHGIALQPDQIDGDQLFKTSFARLSRTEFPPGRGVYVRGGGSMRVQLALPDSA
jgi:S-DNA-T family DNA segregation ATPase FtsK/SpoIIIE